MINKEPIEDMIRSLSMVEADIRSLKKRLEQDIMTSKGRRSNKKYLKMAQLERQMINVLLEDEYLEGISDEDLQKAIQRQ